MRIRFSRRDGGELANDHANGVASLDVAMELRSAINDYLPLLTTLYGWEMWNSHVCEVGIYDLGPSQYGLAALDGPENPYIVVSPRVHDATPELIEQRRRGTLAHELIHLFQFGTPLFRHWYDPTRFRRRDPNWWLHESTALATQHLLASNYPTSFPRLWDWATYPQRSLDSTADGYLALPFLLYLLENLDKKLLADTYRLDSNDVPSMLGCDALDLAIRAAGNEKVTDLPTAFLQYCIDVAPGALPKYQWLKKVTSIVGKRFCSDWFNSYPVFFAGWGAPVDHLGCRYFHFRTPHVATTATTMRLKVTPRPEGQGYSETGTPLRAAAVVVDRDDAGRNAIELCPQNGELYAEIPNVTQTTTKLVILVVANCAFGKGWANHDNAQFTFCAEFK